MQAHAADRRTAFINMQQANDSYPPQQLNITHIDHGCIKELGIENMDLEPSNSYGGRSVYSSEGSNHLTSQSKAMFLSTNSKDERTADFSVAQLYNNNNVTAPVVVLGEDALSQALKDARYPALGLQGYDEWTLDLRRLIIGPAFAQGAFGRLYKGTYNGEDVAIKLLERPSNNPGRAQTLENQFAKEVSMLATLRHENVVRFIGACRKPSVCCIVTEYAKGGSLRMFLSRRGVIPPRVAVKYALDIAQGMEFLHSYGVIHRDLKSDNLLIAERSIIKIADFGVARIEAQTEWMTPELGTYRWMAPEMIQRRSYNNKVDVYSFGIVLWELVTGSIPYQDMTATQAAFAVVHKGLRPAIPRECSPAVAHIMSRCWSANPEARPSFTDVVRLLHEAQDVILSTVGTAVIRRGFGCLARPLTKE